MKGARQGEIGLDGKSDLSKEALTSGRGVCDQKTRLSLVEDL